MEKCSRMEKKNNDGKIKRQEENVRRGQTKGETFEIYLVFVLKITLKTINVYFEA